jgi:hypothetical protein
MRILNKTDYETAPLRELIRRVAEEELDTAHRKMLSVEILYAYRGVTKEGVLGFCFRGGGWVRLILPKDPKRLDLVKLAHVIAHEFGHVRGLNHQQMKGNPRYTWAPAWREEYLRDENGEKIPTGATWMDGTPIKNDYKMKRIEQTSWFDLVKLRGYTDGIEVKKVEKVKPKTTQDMKLEHAKAKVLAWEKKLKRAETGKKTWSRKVKYYERQIAAKKEKAK